ncbi:phosphohydrolase [[Limnothrix rosea] IAM M-220]|nr:phosphohydrolase [[Limnothrix rosea] IAM M-220]
MAKIYGGSESRQRIALIEKLLAIGTALSSASDLGELLQLILLKCCEITKSDAGSVYLMDSRDESNPKLIFKATQNTSLPNIPFEEFSLPLNPKSLAGYVAITGETLSIEDAYNLPETAPYHFDRDFDQKFSYRTCSVLVLPMQDQKANTIGVLQLINRKMESDVTITPANALQVTQSYSMWEETILRSLASQAAISIERNLLQDDIENLFEGFVKASVKAIESRDPTTSGHSERVALLTVGLAEEVSRISNGKLRQEYFGDRQLQEIRYAALLHDFGKIGVPEAILNKRQKLYPGNLEVIRQRFAVAKRTLQWECAQQKFQYLVEHPHAHTKDEAACPHCEKLRQMDEEIDKTLNQLDEYLGLVEKFNRPEAIATKQFEILSEQVFYEFTKLAQYRYRDVDGQLKAIVSEADLEQLLLPRGNLNPEERQAIESHVSQTYEFLKEIPWTKELKNVPDLAYGHHEKLDGTGYPRGLKGDEIPIQTQMMTIADIYDALTAADRPYKKPLPVPVVVRILREEVERAHLSDDLVEVFVNRGVFRVLGHSL